ncbi:hypothetical protein ACFPJ1_34770 [Kribbella qitaiheensis]
MPRSLPGIGNGGGEDELSEALEVSGEVGEVELEAVGVVLPRASS